MQKLTILPSVVGVPAPWYFFPFADPSLWLHNLNAPTIHASHAFSTFSDIAARTHTWNNRTTPDHANPMSSSSTPSGSPIGLVQNSRSPLASTSLSEENSRDADLSSTREERHTSTSRSDDTAIYPQRQQQSTLQRRSNRERTCASVAAILESLEASPNVSAPTASRHKRSHASSSSPSLPSSSASPSSLGRRSEQIEYASFSSYSAASRPQSNKESPTDRHFRCNAPGCTKSFKRSGHLKRHRLVHLPSAHRERFQCHLSSCNKHYSTKYDLAAHVRQVHEGAEVIRCSFHRCNRRFARQESLDLHLKNFDHTAAGLDLDHNLDDDPTSDFSSDSTTR